MHRFFTIPFQSYFSFFDYPKIVPPRPPHLEPHCTSLTAFPWQPNHDLFVTYNFYQNIFKNKKHLVHRFFIGPWNIQNTNFRAAPILPISVIFAKNCTSPSQEFMAVVPSNNTYCLHYSHDKAYHFLCLPNFCFRPLLSPTFAFLIDQNQLIF